MRHHPKHHRAERYPGSPASWLDAVWAAAFVRALEVARKPGGISVGSERWAVNEADLAVRAAEVGLRAQHDEEREVVQICAARVAQQEHA
jgi:hypothetical protein